GGPASFCSPPWPRASRASGFRSIASCRLTRSGSSRSSSWRWRSSLVTRYICEAPGAGSTWCAPRSRSTSTSSSGSFRPSCGSPCCTRWLLNRPSRRSWSCSSSCWRCSACSPSSRRGGSDRSIATAEPAPLTERCMGKLEGKTALVTGGNSAIGLATAKLGRKDGAGLARFTERFAKVNGVRLRYLIGGQGNAVVLLHGYAETGHMWRPIMPSLATRHTVIVPDLRGAGGSAKPASGYDKKTMAVDIHELTRSLKFDRVSIVGHDIGLMVAYAYAAQFPQTAERVILMDAFLPGIGDWKHVWLKRSVPEVDRRLYARAYAQPGAMRAG